MANGNQYISELATQRAVAVRLLQRGLASVGEIARHYGLSRNTVWEWAQDIDGLKARRAVAVAEAVKRAEARST